MSTDEKTPPENAPGGAAVSHCEEGPAKAHGQADTSTPEDVLVVWWKELRDGYYVLCTEDGKAAGWASRELGHDGKNRFRYGVGGLKRDAKSLPDARSLVVMHLADSARRVGLALKLKAVHRRDGEE